MKLVALYAAGKTRPAGLEHGLRLICATLNREELRHLFRSEITVISVLAIDRRWTREVYAVDGYAGPKYADVVRLSLWCSPLSPRSSSSEGSDDRHLMSAQLGGFVRRCFGQRFDERSARRICPRKLRTGI